MFNFLLNVESYQYATFYMSYKKKVLNHKDGADAGL